MDVRIYIAVVIHALALAVLSMDTHYQPVVPWMGAFVVLSALGMALILTGMARVGAILFIIGCVL